MRFWEPAADQDLDRIHEAACRLLEAQGVRIHSSQVIDVLAGAGADVRPGGVVRLPRSLVEQSILSAPESFMVYDRRGGALEIGGANHHHLVGGTMTEIIDYPGWVRRPATLADTANLARLVDALDCVDMTLPAVEGQDAPPGAGEILSCAEVLKNTTKFCLACPVAAHATEAFVAMAKALAGGGDLSGRPTIALLATLVPGYEMDAQAAQTLLIAARERIPIVLMGGSIMGAQGPATMAGGMVMRVAEQLAALCVVQTAGPGTPCLFSWGQLKLDMRTAELEEAGPEFSIDIGVGAQLSRRYGIPSYACPSSDSKVGDFQAGAEFSAQFQAAMLAGSHVTVNAGTAAKCSAASYELLILHNETLRNLERVRRGMMVTDDTLAVDVQLQVGIRGDFLEHEHTRRYVRSKDEFLHKDLFDATGVRAAPTDLFARAKARWQKTLATHRPAVGEADRRTVDEVAVHFIQGGGT